MVGSEDGGFVGSDVLGLGVGLDVGRNVGEGVGDGLGRGVGARVGKSVGDRVGGAVGVGVGVLVPDPDSSGSPELETSSPDPESSSPDPEPPSPDPDLESAASPEPELSLSFGAVGGGHTLNSFIQSSLARRCRPTEMGSRCLPAKRPQASAIFAQRPCNGSLWVGVKPPTFLTIVRPLPLS